MIFCWEFIHPIDVDIPRRVFSPPWWVWLFARQCVCVPRHSSAIEWKKWVRVRVCVSMYVCERVGERERERERRKSFVVIIASCRGHDSSQLLPPPWLKGKKKILLIQITFFKRISFLLRDSFNRILNNYMGLICNFTIKMWLSSLINQWKRALLQLSLWLVIACLHYHNKYPYETN